MTIGGHCLSSSGCTTKVSIAPLAVWMSTRRSFNVSTPVQLAQGLDHLIDESAWLSSLYTMLILFYTHSLDNPPLATAPICHWNRCPPHRDGRSARQRAAPVRQRAAPSWHAVTVLLIASSKPRRHGAIVWNSTMLDSLLLIDGTPRRSDHRHRFVYLPGVARIERWPKARAEQPG